MNSLLERLQAMGGQYADNVNKHFASGVDSMRGGVQDIGANLPLSGVAKTGLGALGAVTAPVNAAIDTFAEPIATGIGGPETGSKVNALLSMLLPLMPGLGVAAKATSRMTRPRDVADALPPYAPSTKEITLPGNGKSYTPNMYGADDPALQLELNKLFQKNPGGSIFDLAGVKPMPEAPRMPYQRSMPEWADPIALLLGAGGAGASIGAMHGGVPVSR